MGYETSLHLIDVKIRGVASNSERALQTKKERGLSPLKYFLDQAFLSGDEFICFIPKGNYTSPYSSDEDDGAVPAVQGKL